MSKSTNFRMRKKNVVSKQFKHFIVINWPDGDPNWFYRNWLETNIGEQKKDWDWFTHDCPEPNGLDSSLPKLAIHSNDEKMLSLFSLTFQ